MAEDDDDELRRLGTRLEWIYPVDPANPMVTLLAPLFREPEGDDVAADGGPARPAEPPTAPLRRRLRP